MEMATDHYPHGNVTGWRMGKREFGLILLLLAKVMKITSKVAM